MAAASPEQRSVWAWGNRSREPSQADLDAAAVALSKRYSRRLEPARLPDPSAIKLRPPRVRVPGTLAGFVSAHPQDRAFHSYGHSFPDRVRKFRLEYPDPVDAVAHPRDEAEVTSVLDWCSASGYAAIPFGGGSSVAGGVNPPPGAAASVSIDLSGLSRVLEVDSVSRAARIQAGAFGPVIEGALKPHGLTLRHFPQSFEFSTLGGWIATRSAGHYATNHTHIDEFVEAVRVVSPAGTWESRRLPGGGAGPDPNRLITGSEGTLGIITEAWVRVQASPEHRASAGVTFATFDAAAAAARAITQAKLWPANCRVLDPGEAQAAAGMDGESALLVLGFESSDLPQDSQMRDALQIARSNGGTVLDQGAADPVATWRRSFIDMPYVWNTLLGVGLINDTFETAITWDRWPAFDSAVRTAVQGALNQVCGGGSVTCRFTHVYTDGPAPYYTFAGLGRRGSEVEMWRELKQAASDAVIAAGGTITHHHAVGREHAPWYSRERPDLFAAAMNAARNVLDPRGVMNPGVLWTE